MGVMPVAKALPATDRSIPALMLLVAPLDKLLTVLCRLAREARTAENRLFKGY
jgi:hypothetical protein